MTIIDGISEILADISTILHSNIFDHPDLAHISFLGDRVGVGGILHNTSLDPNCRVIFTDNDPAINTTFNRLCMPYDECQQYKKSASILCFFLSDSRAIIQKKDLIHYSSVDDFFKKAISQDRSIHHFANLLVVLYNTEPDVMHDFCSEFLTNRKPWPGIWSNEYDKLILEFTKTCNISKDDSDIGQSFFNLPQTALDLSTIYRENSGNSHAYNLKELLFSKWTQYIERQKLVLIASDITNSNTTKANAL